VYPELKGKPTTEEIKAGCARPTGGPVGDTKLSVGLGKVGPAFGEYDKKVSEAFD